MDKPQVLTDWQGKESHLKVEAWIRRIWLDTDDKVRWRFHSDGGTYGWNLVDVISCLSQRADELNAAVLGDCHKLSEDLETICYGTRKIWWGEMIWYLIIIRNNEERDNDDKCNSNEWGKNSILLIYCGYKGRGKKGRILCICRRRKRNVFTEHLWDGNVE